MATVAEFWRGGMKRCSSTENDFLLYIGLDWGTEFHQACVLDVSGKIVHKSKIGHNGQAIATSCD